MRRSVLQGITLKRSGNTATGPDGIRHKDIYGLPDDDIGELTNEFTACLRDGMIREEWLPKPNKDLSRIGSYRIITLQDITGKLLEKIIARRLSDDLERRQLFPSTRGGYREGKDTWCNAAVFAYEVFEGFQEGMETYAAIIDLEDA